MLYGKQDLSKFTPKDYNSKENNPLYFALQPLLDFLQNSSPSSLTSTRKDCLGIYRAIESAIKSGEGESINVILALLAIQATLAVAIAFSDSQKIRARQLANLNIFTCLLIAFYIGATAFDLFGKYNMFGVLFDFAFLLGACYLAFIGSLTNSKYVDDLLEWRKKLDCYIDKYGQIIKQTEDSMEQTR